MYGSQLTPASLVGEVTSIPWLISLFLFSTKFTKKNKKPELKCSSSDIGYFFSHTVYTSSLDCSPKQSLKLDSLRF